MSLFTKILEKIGLSKPAAPAAPVAAAPKPAPAVDKGEKDKIPAPAAAVKPVAKTAPVAGAKPASTPVAFGREEDMADAARASAAAVAPKVAAIPEVDVVAKIEKMASGSGLNWKVSIVDLLKILGIDSSLDARKELATELGCPADLMKDSAKMNVWLHKEVLKQIAQNGGNIPKDLLD